MTAPQPEGVRRALAEGWQAVQILEAPPLDEGHGYTPDEEAHQYAAVDRLVAAFKTLHSSLGEKESG